MEQEIIIEEVVPTTQEVIASKQSQLLNISSELKATDYIAMKELDGEDVSKYGDYKSCRKALRAEYNAMEKEIENLIIQLESEANEVVEGI